MEILFTQSSDEQPSINIKLTVDEFLQMDDAVNAAWETLMRATNSTLGFAERPSTIKAHNFMADWKKKALMFAVVAGREFTKESISKLRFFYLG